MKNLAGLALAPAVGIIASLAALPLAGCSGSAMPAALPAAASPSFTPLSRMPASPDSNAGKAQLLYVADEQSNEIYVYDAAATTQNPPPLRTISSGIASPQGITTDQSGNLYVTDTGNDTVTVYTSKSNALKLTISNGINAPSDVKVDGFGNVYVANSPFGSNPYVTEYPKGSSTASYTWTSPISGAIDAIGLLNDLKSGHVSLYATVEIPDPSAPEGRIVDCTPGHSTCKELSYSLGGASGIAIAQSPTQQKTLEFLAIDSKVPGVDTFVAGSLTSQFFTPGGATSIALDAKESKIFISENEAGEVAEYSFPGYQLRNTFTTADATVGGVATYPPGTYH